MTTLTADIGGTSVKLGIVQRQQVVAHQRIELASRTQLAPVLEAMSQAWQAMLTQLGLSLQEAQGVALAFAGVVNPRAGRIVSVNGKFLDAPSMDLAHWAKQSLGLPLTIDNDARMALVGEWKAGAGQGADDLVMVTLGTGIGAAAVCEGRVLRGSHGMAGINGGHLTVNLYGRLCTCGNIGCAEAHASTDRLPQIISETAEQLGIALPAWATAPSLNYKLVFEQAQTGDRLATAVRDESVAIWSVAIVNLIHAYGPQRVVVGGGITQGSPWLVSVFQQYVDRHAWTPWGHVEVCLAKLGDQAALIGCDAMVHANKERSC